MFYKPNLSVAVCTLAVTRESVLCMSLFIHNDLGISPLEAESNRSNVLRLEMT